MRSHQAITSGFVMEAPKDGIIRACCVWRLKWYRESLIVLSVGVGLKLGRLPAFQFAEACIIWLRRPKYDESNRCRHYLGTNKTAAFGTR